MDTREVGLDVQEEHDGLQGLEAGQLRVGLVTLQGQRVAEGAGRELHVGGLGDREAFGSGLGLGLELGSTIAFTSEMSIIGLESWT